MTLYERFLALGLDLGPLGFGAGSARSGYDCTPPGAQVLGWAGVDGIHYCSVPGFGEMVFAVSPMELPGDTVHPVARSFEDFLCLLLACGSCAALDQAHGWTQAQFEQFLVENRPDAAQTSLLAQLSDGLGLAPMEQPFAYLKELQSGFGSTRLPRTEAPAEAPAQPAAEPCWQVYFDGGFWGHPGRSRPGQELPLNKTFLWGGRVWHVPSAYLCAAGLVLDLCLEAEPACIRAFGEKWGLYENDTPDLSPEQQERMAAEHPLDPDLRPCLSINGRPSPQSHGCGLTWLPAGCLPPGTQNDEQAAACLAHYGLDTGRGWAIRRFAFPWATRRRPQLRSLRVTLAQAPVCLLGPRFTTPPTGGTLTFTHPVTGAVHTLTVMGWEPQVLTLPPSAQGQFAAYRVPSYYVGLTYTLAPDLPEGECFVRDCAPGDAPAMVPAAGGSPAAPEGSGCIGIIGGPDGPTALFLHPKASDDGPHAACSSLRFQPVEQVEWQVVFRHKPVEDIEVTLLEQ